jgi:hypothetical protein
MNRFEDELSDAEYEVMTAMAARIGLTARFGPCAEEVAEFGVTKKILNKVLPRWMRWRLSWMAPEIRTFMKNTPASIKWGSRKDSLKRILLRRR